MGLGTGKRFSLNFGSFLKQESLFPKVRLLAPWGLSLSAVGVGEGAGKKMDRCKRGHARGAWDRALLHYCAQWTSAEVIFETGSPEKRKGAPHPWPLIPPALALLGPSSGEHKDPLPTGHPEAQREKQTNDQMIVRQCRLTGQSSEETLSVLRCESRPLREGMGEEEEGRKGLQEEGVLSKGTKEPVIHPRLAERGHCYSHF